MGGNGSLAMARLPHALLCFDNLLIGEAYLHREKNGHDLKLRPRYLLSGPRAVDRI
jgi:hypothetical protein